jgi:hypothetical protein
MKKMEWFERQFTFGLPMGMLPFYLERLEGTLARIEKRTSGIKEEVLSHKLDGKWSIKENIAHLAEVDEIACKRIDEMKQGVSPMSPAVIQPGRDYNAQSIAEVIRFFKANREKNLQKYKSLVDADLIKSSLHPRLKVLMTPVDLAWFDAEHDDHHLARVNEILNTLLK